MLLWFSVSLRPSSGSSLAQRSQLWGQKCALLAAADRENISQLEGQLGGQPRVWLHRSDPDETGGGPGQVSRADHAEDEAEPEGEVWGGLAELRCAQGESEKDCGAFPKSKIPPSLPLAYQEEPLTLRGPMEFGGHLSGEGPQSRDLPEQRVRRCGGPPVRESSGGDGAVESGGMCGYRGAESPRGFVQAKVRRKKLFVFNFWKYTTVARISSMTNFWIVISHYL